MSWRPPSLPVLEDQPCESHDWKLAHSQGALPVNVIGTVVCASCMASPPTLDQLVETYVEHERIVKVGVAHLSGELDQLKADCLRLGEVTSVLASTLDSIRHLLDDDAVNLEAARSDMLDLIQLAQRCISVSGVVK